MNNNEEEYKPYRNPTCAQPNTKVMPSGARITHWTIEHMCEEYTDCCYCYDCHYDDKDENGTPYCVVCGEYEVYDDEPVRD